VEKLGLLETCDVIGSSLVDMYFNSGNVAKGEHVFHKLRVQDRVSWTILMGGYAQLGEIENALLIFEGMLGGGIKPDPVTFLVVLKICTRVVSINKGCT
jgi:pentatricopeptide repeat protein